VKSARSDSNPLVNLRLGLPSAAGNNTMIVTNNVALQAIP